MNISVLASSSKGNCTLVYNDNTAILIDMGISMRRLKQALSKEPISLGDISGIFITHEHSDHIKGLQTLTKYHPVPIYTRAETFRYISSGLTLTQPRFVELTERNLVQVGDLTIDNFSISHDAANPCGYKIKDIKHTVAVATDLGHINDNLVDMLQDTDGIVIEANYDAQMLRNGEYPLFLKQRIAGSEGHLSNVETAQLLSKLKNLPQEIILAHLSENNNLPSLAYSTVTRGLENSSVNLNNHNIQVASSVETIKFQLD